MPFSVLDLDVLTEIVSYFSPREALLITPTCKIFHQLALPIAVKEVVLRMRTVQPLNKFVSFVHKDLERRSALLRRIELRAEMSPYRPGSKYGGLTLESEQLDASRLAAVLSSAHQLRSVTLDWAEDLFRTHRLVGQAFRRLDNLEDIVLDDIGRSTIHVLCSLRSALRHITLLSGECDTAPFVPSYSLSSLTSLEIHNIDSRDILSGGQDLILPNVRKLVWDRSCVSLSVLYRVFPNLTVLELCGNMYDGTDNSWKNFDHLAGWLNDVDELFLNGRVKTVRRLTIVEDGPVFPDGEESWDMFMPIFHQCSPVVLSLSIDPKDNYILPPGFSDAARNLRFLKVTLLGEEIMYAHSWFLNLYENMKDLQLVAFSLCISRERRAPETEEIESDMAFQLAGAVPSASLVGFEMVSELNSFHLWWGVLHQGRSRVVMELPENVGQAAAEMASAATGSSDLKAQIESYLRSAGI